MSTLPAAKSSRKKRKTSQKAPTNIALLKSFEQSSENVKGYFQHLPKLIKEFPHEVCLAYLFLRLEQAHNRALYCGVVKLHHADGDLTDRIINNDHVTRDKFQELYQSVFGSSVPEAAKALLTTAEKIRDKVIHGKDVSAMEKREAIVDVIKYAEAFNNELKLKAGFEPFGDLRGFSGAAQKFGKDTTRWLLKGLGFSVA